jgi:release factor glutamine methyltransferase
MSKATAAVGTEPPWTIGRLLEWTTAFLTQKGSESPRLDTEVLLAQALGCKRIELYTRHDQVAPEEARQKFRELIRRRVEGCPVAYLVGRKEFFSLALEVGPAVLIPRPDTECVVDECLRLAKGMTAVSVLDVGTGSGCLAVAVAHQHKGAKVTATDVSADALAVATRNAARHGVADRVRFLQGDVYAPLGADERFDFILSNPPYIRRGDIPGLPVGVRQYEPHLALDGGPDGFAVFDRLVAGAAAHLNPGGWLVVEIGTAQEGPGRQRMEQTAGLEPAKTVHDGSGHPRVLRARKKTD